MSKHGDLKKLERWTYLAYHQDGLIDIIVGFCTIGLGLNLLTKDPVVGVFGWVPILFYAPLKSRITFPRFGYVRFNPNRDKRLRLLIALGVFGLALIFFAGWYFFATTARISPATQSWLRQYFMFPLMGLIALCFLGAALATRIRRFYSYTGLIVLFVLLGSRWNIHPPLYIIALGSLFVLSGIWMLVHFLQKYPPTTEENSNVVG